MIFYSSYINYIDSFKYLLFNNGESSHHSSHPLFRGRESSVLVYTGPLLCKERITGEVKILNASPTGQLGYALGISTYEKVYIPEKFRGYIPEVGETMRATIGLGDVSHHNGRPKMCRLNVIFIH